MADNATALQLLADEVRTVSTWHSGSREAKLLLLADRLEALANGGDASWADEAKAKVDADAQELAALKAQQEQEQAEKAAEAQKAAEARKAQQKATQPPAPPA